VHTKVPRQRTPVEEYLKLQGRYRHLFEPERNAVLLGEIQQRVDRYWQAVD
jgi:pyruvate ferredoxin oxidoreductase beta subunit